MQPDEKAVNRWLDSHTIPYITATALYGKLPGTADVYMEYK